MGTTFTGSDVWVETLDGPVDTDPATGLTVTDMGTQLANRTYYTAERIEDTYTRRVIATVDYPDAASAYGTIDSIATDTWNTLATFSLIASPLPVTHTDCGVRAHFQGNVISTLADFGELRLRFIKGAIDVVSPHWRVGPGGIIVPVSIEFQYYGIPDSDITVQLQGRLDTAAGALNLVGSARMVVESLELVNR